MQLNFHPVPWLFSVAALVRPVFILVSLRENFRETAYEFLDYFNISLIDRGRIRRVGQLVKDKMNNCPAVLFLK